MEGTAENRSSLGGVVFRWRSYLPLLAVAGLAVGVASGLAIPPPWRDACLWAGLAIAATGLALRLYAVGHAPPGTSGRHRKQHAERLNTFGLYSVVRHPLYAGNVLVWAGASLTSCWPLGAAASALLAVATFAAIVRHEDAFLAARFGEAFREWAAVTPAFVPRLALWRPTRGSFRWRKAVASEYSTLHSIVLLALLFAALRRWAGTGSEPGAGWWVLLIVNSALYLGLRSWRDRGRGAERSREMRS